MNKKFVLGFLFFFSLVVVSAIGVSPARTTIDFTPGFEGVYTITILNSEEKNLSLVLSSQGELQEYIFPVETIIKIGSTDILRDTQFKVSLPKELKPGLHTGGVAIVEVPEKFVETGETTIGTSVAILTQVYVNSPYPGKYIEAELNVLGPDENGLVKFFILATNKGEFTITSVEGIIEIKDALGGLIATVKTNEVSIPGGERRELKAEWGSSELAPGTYTADTVVKWDEGTVNLEKEFVIGKKRLIVKNIEVNNFKLGDIAKFEITAESTWNNVIEDAEAEVVVYSAVGNILAAFKSASQDIQPNEEALFLAYWDTKGVTPEDYDSILYLNYGDFRDPTSLTFSVKDDKIIIYGLGFVVSDIGVGGIGKGTLYFLLTVIVILVLANISWFLYLRKRFKKR